MTRTSGTLAAPSEQPLTVRAYLFILEGFSAAHNDKPASANPYGPGTEQEICWRAGWVEAARDAIDYGKVNYRRMIFAEFAPPTDVLAAREGSAERA
jgi:hypothetical protein